MVKGSLACAKLFKKKSLVTLAVFPCVVVSDYGKSFKKHANKVHVTLTYTSSNCILPAHGYTALYLIKSLASARLDKE